MLIADGRSKRLSNLGGPNSSRVLGPQGLAVADFPSSNELDAANGIVQEDAAIEINRKLVVDSLKASFPPEAVPAASRMHHVSRMHRHATLPVQCCADITCIVCVAVLKHMCCMCSTVVAS